MFYATPNHIQIIRQGKSRSDCNNGSGRSTMHTFLLCGSLCRWFTYLLQFDIVDPMLLHDVYTKRSPE